jgi:hypothetical protein
LQETRIISCMNKKGTQLSLIIILLILPLCNCARTYDMETIHGSLQGYLFINEVFADGTETEDWIELYNLTTGPVDLSGFYLGDDPDDPCQWSFPGGTIIMGNNFLAVDANNEDTGLQTNFSLGPGEAVILTTPGGTTTIDMIDYDEIHMPINCSYGRYIDGGDIWITFTQPTKGESNHP